MQMTKEEREGGERELSGSRSAHEALERRPVHRQQKGQSRKAQRQSKHTSKR